MLLRQKLEEFEKLIQGTLNDSNYIHTDINGMMEKSLNAV